jgi:two-component system KDP operon response regulator KdpE
MSKMDLLMAEAETTTARPKQQSKIMIVDDDADLRRALGIRLRANHYNTLSTGDGYSALALAQKERPDLVLLDLGLPGFATGADVLKHMRAFPSLARIPVIVLTGRDLRDYKEPMLELGAAACLQKPVENDELLNRIHYCLQGDNERKGLPTIRFRDPKSGRFYKGRTT